MTKTCWTAEPPPPLCRIFHKKYTDNFWNRPLARPLFSKSLWARIGEKIYTFKIAGLRIASSKFSILFYPIQFITSSACSDVDLVAVGGTSSAPAAAARTSQTIPVLPTISYF